MIARKSFIIMVGNTICGVLGLLVIFILSKLWGAFAADAFGVIGFSMAFVGMFSFISDLGFGNAHVKRVSEGRDLGTCIGTYISLKLALIAIMVLIVVGGIAVWKHVLNNGFYDATKESVIYIFLGYYVFLSLAQIPIYTFNGRKEIAKSQASSLTETLTRVGLMLVVALAGVSGAFVGLSATIVNISPRYAWPQFLQPLQVFLANHAIGSLSMAYMLGNLMAFVIAMILFHGYPIKRPTRECARSYVEFAMPMALAAILGTISLNLDKVMIGYFWSSTEVGYYFAIQRITVNLLMFSTAVGFLLFPTVSSLNSQKNNREIRAITLKAERYMSLLVLPILVFLIVFSSEVINIFLNASFIPAKSTLQILSIYTFFATIRVPYVYLLVGMNRLKAFTVIAAMDFGLNISLNLLLIPQNGLLSTVGIAGHNGAALATVITTIVTLAIYRSASRKALRKRLTDKFIFKHVAVAAVTGFVLHLSSSLVEPLRYYHLILFGLAGLGLYLGLLWVIREFRKGDYLMVMNAIAPKGIFGYLKSELSLKKSRD